VTATTTATASSTTITSTSSTLPSTTSTTTNTTSTNSTTTNQGQTNSNTNHSTGGSPATTSTPIDTNTTDTAATTSSTAPTIISSEQINQAVNKILNYLKFQQDKTGKIIDAGITDWSIMSFVAAGQNPAEIKKYDGLSLFEYAKNYQFTDASDINICAAYPRHYLALYTSGLDTSDNLMRQIINDIKSKCYLNNLYGQRGINDDIFGLIALLSAGTDIAENIIQDIIKTITEDQTVDGAFTWDGWPGADITGGAVNTLKYARNKGINLDETIFTKAKNYLKTQQLDDGGWGYFSSDALTTSWAIMGISSLNESQTDWFKDNKNPWNILIETLNNSGYYEPNWAPGTTDWFATKHGVPALLGQSWPIEPRFSQNQYSGANPNFEQLNNNTSSTTSTVTIPTTTIIFTTSTVSSSTAITTTSTILISITASSSVATTSTTTTSTVIEKIKLNVANSTKEIAKPKLTKITETSKTKKQQPTEDKNNFTYTNSGQAKQQLAKETPTELIPTSSARSTAKKVAATSGSGALILGLYLGWKLLKYIV